MSYYKSIMTFGGSYGLKDMNDNYHLDLYINDTLISNESEINNALHPTGTTNNPDKIEYRCRTGYMFSGDVYGHIRNKEGTQLRPLMTVTNNTIAFYNVSQGNGGSVKIYPEYKGTFRKDGVDTPYLTVVASANNIPVSASLNNCSLSPVVSNIPKGSVSNFTITADNGFKFTSIPSVYTLAGGVANAVQVTKVNDYEFTFSVTPAENDESLNIYADAVSESVSFIKTLSNCSVSPAGNTLTIGVAVTVTITANSGYIFDAENKPVLYWLDNEQARHEISLTKVSDYEYTTTFTPDETDYYLDASAITEPSSIPLEKNLTNCSLSPDVNSFIDGKTYNIILTAEPGYIFDVAPSFSYRNSEASLITIPLIKVSDYVYKYDGLTIEADRATKYIITAYASIESVTSNKYGVLQIHKIDADTLKAFNDLRYYSGSGSLSQIDLSQYISALKVIFADATSTANDNILVSNINTGISAPKIDNDYITLDLGNVLLAGMYHNTLDKMYSEIFLNLPFVDVYKLDSIYMNETINIKYRVNLISGDSAIFISIVRDSEEFLIDVINVNMSFDLPYVYPIESDIKQLNTKIKAVNFNVAPAVTIKQRLKADANNNIYQCYKIDTPANENGYFKIDRMDADTIPASVSIRNKIENLLKAGVYI